MEIVSEGQQAPNFTVLTTVGQITLSDLISESEKGVVLYFYPRANTPGCTVEACDFRDNMARIVSSGYMVLGISPDSVDDLKKFRDNHDLPFPLGSDPDHQIMSLYGAWGEKKNYGKTVVGVIRSTIVINSDGNIHRIKHNVRAKGHVERLLRELI